MKSKFILVFFAAGALLRPASAADVDLSKLPPPSDKKDVTYAADIQPIFKATCFGCHSAQRQRGGVRLDSLEAVLKGGDDGAIITPGKSDKSPLVIAVARLDPKKAMPPMRGPGGRPPRGPGGPGGQDGAPNPPGGGPDAGAPPHDAPDAAQAPGAGPAPGGPPPSGDRGPGPGGQGGPGGPRGRGPGPKPLTPEQVGLIRAWIDQGAK